MITNLQTKIKLIDDFLSQKDAFCQQRLFDKYAAMTTCDKESFVLALIGKLTEISIRFNLSPKTI